MGEVLLLIEQGAPLVALEGPHGQPGARLPVFSQRQIPARRPRAPQHRSQHPGVDSEFRRQLFERNPVSPVRKLLQRDHRDRDELLLPLPLPVAPAGVEIEVDGVGPAVEGIGTDTGQLPAARAPVQPSGLDEVGRVPVEEDAVSLYAYECRAIPGLLQPEAYIRAIFDRRLPPASEEQIEREVASRLDRQQLISTNQNTAFSFVIEESVVARRMGGRDVTRQVIDRLLEMSARRNVEIQIMATIQEDHCGIDGQMYLAETAAHQWLGYTEGQRSSSLISTPKDVSVLLQRYGRLRSQALDCRATVTLLERMRGAL
ncbi:DUF5753 domain-containing protein [Streptomyces thermolilacinus]|uniref:DUF5753 domain-containing protein n=1 Tax=Streptomyces thermolilacinus TaxID=285540 RepID=UPI0033F6D7F5